MEWSRVKNILIILLILVNCFLIGDYMTAELKKRAEEAGVREDTYQILSGLGIKIDRELIPPESGVLYPARIERDLEKEQSSAEKLLGRAEKTEPGGGKITYSGETGSISFRNGGLFDMEINARGISDTKTARKTAVTRLKPLGISTKTDLITVEEEQDYYIITIPQLFSGYRVFNCVNPVKIKKNGVLEVSGRRAAGNIVFARGIKPRSISGLLLDFTDQVQGVGEITELETGFVVENVSGTGTNLVPVWHIKADNTDYYISALDGKLVSIN